jgi:HK97 gp10 family phage protein
LSSRIDEIVTVMKISVEATSFKAAKLIAAEAARRAPQLGYWITYPSFQRGPDWLAESITAHPAGDGEDVASVRVGRYWGLFQERGTEHMTPQPFLEPAADDLYPNVIHLYEQAVKEACE